MGNDNLHKALKNKNDEFYTFYEDIEKELVLYKEHFIGKTILLAADDEESNFWKYFINNFSNFQIKLLIATHFTDYDSYVLFKDAFSCKKKRTKDHGDFFGEEVQSLLSNVDIVITNPPFSRFREFIISIIEKNKDFILVGTENAATAKEVFPLFKEEKIFFGKNKIKSFLKPDGTTQDFGNITWLTSFRNNFNEPFIPTKELKEQVFYDNYEAINIDKLNDIPNNYFGPMGVPITYLKRQNSNLFSILGIGSGISKKNKLYGRVVYHENKSDRGGAPLINGKIKYTRVFIERKPNG